VSILYVTMAILGGITTLVGAAIGSAMLTALPELLRGAAEYKDFLTGLLLLLLLIFLPNGIVGFVRQRFIGAMPAKNGHSASGRGRMTCCPQRYSLEHVRKITRYSKSRISASASVASRHWRMST